MLEFKGSKAACKVFIDSIEDTAAAQIREFLECPAFEGEKLRIMPDVHAGAGAVIGFTSTFHNKVIPNVIGVDIGCGMLAVPLPVIPTEIDLPAFDDYVKNRIPSGFAINEKYYSGPLAEEFINVAEQTGQHVDRVLRSVGTLGGGNHFIELDVDNTGRAWLVVHTGSRNFGLRIANYHQKIAQDNCQEVSRKDLAWLEGDMANYYLNHMQVAQRFATENRHLIVKCLLQFFGTQDIAGSIEAVHNFIDFEDMIIRKGAIAARQGQKVVIPWNMRDGMILGEGLGNDEWNCSAPHGAGRVMGRRQAQKTLNLEDFQESMAGIYSSCITKDTLDEAPAVYKPFEQILEVIGETVKVEHVLKPIYNFKATE